MSSEDVGFDEYLLGDSCPQYHSSSSEEDDCDYNVDVNEKEPSTIQSNVQNRREDEEIQQPFPDSLQPEMGVPDSVLPDSFVADSVQPELELQDWFLPDSEEPEVGLADSDVQGSFVPDSQEPEMVGSGSNEVEDDEYGSPIDLVIDEMLGHYIPFWKTMDPKLKRKRKKW